MKVFCFFAMAVTAMLAAGCATSRGVRLYPGEARPMESVAQVVAAAEFDVKTVDGAKTSAEMISTASETVFELLPGHHEIVARFYSPFENGPASAGTSYEKPDRSEFQTLTLDANARRRYAIQRKTENRTVRLFISESGPAVALGSSAIAMKPPEATATDPNAATPAQQEQRRNNPPPVYSDPSTVRPKEEHVETPKITPLDNLKQWWFYASPAERAEFRTWIDAAKQ